MDETDIDIDDGGSNNGSKRGHENLADMDDDTLAAIDMTRDQYNNSPGWVRGRLVEMRRHKNEAKEEAARYRSELDSLRGEVSGVRELAQAAAAATKAPAEDKPFVQKASEDQLRAAATRIMSLSDLARDPDVTPEERASAKDQLKNLGDYTSVLFDIQQEIADRRSNKATGTLRQELSEREGLTTARNQLVNKLFTSFGKDAIDKVSPLSQAAFAKLRAWSDQHGLTAGQVNDFMTYKAFEEAATELRSKSPGRRGADPRNSPVLGANGTRSRDGDDALESLERKGAKGDWQARRKASSMKFQRFLAENGLLDPAR